MLLILKNCIKAPGIGCQFEFVNESICRNYQFGVLKSGIFSSAETEMEGKIPPVILRGGDRGKISCWKFTKTYRELHYKIEIERRVAKMKIEEERELEF